MGAVSATRRKMALASAALVLASAGDVGAIKVAVRATATLDARVTPDGDAQVIRGTLRDDVGAAVPGAHVEVTVLTEAGKRVDLPPPRPCSTNAGGHAPHAAPDAYVLDTDGQGVFCVRTGTLPMRGTLRIRFTGQGHVAATSVDLPFDADRSTPALAWDPAPTAVDLDTPSARWTVMATTRAGGGKALDGVNLLLRDERGHELSRARTDERGRASFDVSTSALAGPGSGELEVRGVDANLPPLRTKIVRVARVALVGAPPTSAIVPHDGHAFAIAAETSRGPAATGAVEARIGQEIVGATNVQDGRARVVTTFDVPAEGMLEVTFHYLPSGPDLRPGEPLSMRVPVRPPSPWRRAPLFVLAAGLIAWLSRGWRRPPRGAPRKKPAQAGAPPRLPDLVVQAHAGATVLQGQILDAHERAPIAGATVTVLSRDFLGERAIGAVESDAQGAFVLDVPWEPSRIMLVEAPDHARLEKPLPKPGRARIALVSRRRALLDRFVAALRRAPGWDATPEPTPGSVVARAEARGEGGVVRWAKAVEEAAYGASRVDASREARVIALETDLPVGEPRLPRP